MIVTKHVASQALSSARCSQASVVVSPRRLTVTTGTRLGSLHGSSGRCTRLRASDGEPPATASPPEPSPARPPRRSTADEAPQRDIVIPILVAISLAGYAAVALIAFLDQ